MTDLEFTKEQILAALKHYDPRTFKCEKILRDLDEMKILEDSQSILLELLKRDKDAFGHMEEKLRRPDIPKASKNDKMIDHFNKFRASSRYCDWDTTPMKMWEWTFKNQYFDNHVGDDFIKDWRVSTVWLGLNMGMFETIQIFETMIFKETDGETKCDFDMFQRRYKYYVEAVEGHKEVCDLVREELFDKLMALED